MGTGARTSDASERAAESAAEKHQAGAARDERCGWDAESGCEARNSGQEFDRAAAKVGTEAIRHADTACSTHLLIEADVATGAKDESPGDRRQRRAGDHQACGYHR